MNIDHEFAEFIDLDLSQELMLEIELNIQVIINFPDEELEQYDFDRLFFGSSGIKNFIFHQSDAAMVNEQARATAYYPRMFKQLVDEALLNAANNTQSYSGSALLKILDTIVVRLKNLNAQCIICFKPLGKHFKKIRTCESQMCDFQFQSFAFGNLFAEVKRDPEIALFLTNTAYAAFKSHNAANLTEPFPPFLLKKREVRPEKGNLDFIAAA